MQRHLLEVASEEQRRIGRELHDGTGQELTGLTLSTIALLEMLDTACIANEEGMKVRQLEEHAFLRIRETIAKVNQKVIDANRHVHELCHGIMPVQIDTGSLQSALEELALSTSMPPTINCRFVCPWPVVLSDNATATQLYRIAQEAVNNALRHSQATEVAISLYQNGKEMLVVSGFQESLYAERACRAGAKGFLNKQESSAQLMEAIRTVLSDELYLSPAMTRRLLNQSLAARDQTKSPIENLTNRELEIFRMIGEGLTSGQIAERLVLSPYTIDTHRENIKRKLDIRNAAELSRTAVQWLLENN